MRDPAVKIGRVQRKVARALKQRDHWKAQHDQLRDVLNKFPFIERRHQSLMDRRAEREQLRGLEQRVKEQAALIERMTQEQPK